jgi:hypothetical protein
MSINYPKSFGPGGSGGSGGSGGPGSASPSVTTSGASTSEAAAKPLSPWLAKFAQANNLAGLTRQGRIIFCLDATASREPTWDLSAQLTGRMFDTVGRLETQLVYYRGLNECQASAWFPNAATLKGAMSKIMCRSGETQIGKILRHARDEHRKKPISAVIFIGDCSEEQPDGLYTQALELGIPLFIFQDGNYETANVVFSRLAKLTKGAHAKFEPGALKQLGELLHAVATYATGGLTALTNQNTDAAKLLLTQIKS